MLKKFWTKWDQRVRKKTSGGVWRGWALFSIIFMLGIALLSKSIPWGIILLSVNGFYFLSGLYIIEEPEVGILFRFGSVVGKIGPGYWLVVPFVHSIEIETTARQVLHLDDTESERQDLYYIDDDRKIAINASMRVFFRLVSVEDAIRTFGSLGTAEARSDVEGTSLAALRTVLGNHTFAELLTNKGTIEQEIESITNTEFDESGYKVESIDIYDYEETVQSESARIRELGAAKAFETHKMTEAVAEPLKDNYPAAIATSVSTLATTAREIAQERMKARKKGSKENSSDEDSARIADALKTISDRPGG